MIHILSAISTAIPLLTALLLLKLKGLSKELKILLTFLGVAAFTELIVTTSSIMRTPNLWVAHIYTLLEYVLIAFLLSLWQQNNKIARLVRLSIPLYLLAYFIIEISGLENFGLDSLNHLTRPTALVLLSGIALYTLLQLWQSTTIDLYQNFRFWVLAALVIYYTGTVIIFAFMFIKENRVLRYLLLMHSPLNILHNLLFTMGILCYYWFDEKELAKAAQSAS